jgi:hypothetical protein
MYRWSRDLLPIILQKVTVIELTGLYQEKKEFLNIMFLTKVIPPGSFEMYGLRPKFHFSLLLSHLPKLIEGSKSETHNIGENVLDVQPVVFFREKKERPKIFIRY